MTHLIKRKGHKEKFDEKKIYASVYYACRTCDMSEKKSEQIAGNVTSEVVRLYGQGKLKTSHDIFTNVAMILEKHHKDAAFMYETHRDIS